MGREKAVHAIKELSSGSPIIYHIGVLVKIREMSHREAYYLAYGIHPLTFLNFNST